MATTVNTAVPIICRLPEGAVPDIARIEAESNRPPWPAELFQSEFRHSYSYTYGARTGGDLVAFLVAHFVLDELHILNFGVKKENRRGGIGRALITHVLYEFHERSARWVTLEVRHSNHAARNLYEALGFSEIGIRERYYTDDGEDGLVLRLNLQQFLSEFPPT